MMDLRDFAYLKPVKRGHKTLLYGSPSPDGPWFRLSKRETAFIATMQDRILPPVKKVDT